MSETTKKILMRGIDFASIATLTTVIVYVGGWAFAEQFFAHFNVGLLTLEIPFQYYLVYGFSALQDQWPWGLLIYTFGVFVYLWGRGGIVFLRSITWLSTVITMLAPVVIVGLIVASYDLGARTGSERFAALRSADYPGYHRVKIWLKAESKSMAPMRDELTRGCYRLLLHNQGNLFVFRSTKGALGAELPTDILPKSEVKIFRILPDTTSCVN